MLCLLVLHHTGDLFKGLATLSTPVGTVRHWTPSTSCWRASKLQLQWLSQQAPGTLFSTHKVEDSLPRLVLALAAGAAARLHVGHGATTGLELLHSTERTGYVSLHAGNPGLQNVLGVHVLGVHMLGLHVAIHTSLACKHFEADVASGGLRTVVGVLHVLLHLVLAC